MCRLSIVLSSHLELQQTFAWGLPFDGTSGHDRFRTFPEASGNSD